VDRSNEVAISAGVSLSSGEDREARAADKAERLDIVFHHRRPLKLSPGIAAHRLPARGTMSPSRHRNVTAFSKAGLDAERTHPK
jgi:hypothetical protein